MFTTNEWLQLVAAAKSRTDSRDLLWKPAKSVGAYQAQLNVDTVAVLRGVDDDGQPPYELTIFRRNPEPDAATKWKLFDSTDTQEMVEPDGWGDDKLSDLYTSVMRQTNEVDVIFRSIMENLRPEG